MSIVYNFDNSEEYNEPLERTVCPICRQGRQSNALDVYDCSQCGSTLECDENFKIRLRHNNVQFSKSNLTYGILTLLIIIGYVIFDAFYSNTYLEIVGYMFIVTPFILIIHLVSFNQTQFQRFVDLYKALITFRIRHYDWGSKIFIYSIFILQLISLYLAIK
jgi:hypothetical protein